MHLANTDAIAIPRPFEIPAALPPTSGAGRAPTHSTSALDALRWPRAFAGLGRPEPTITDERLPAETSIAFSNNLLFAQRKHQCGPCVAAAGISYSTGIEIQPDTLSAEKAWSFPIPRGSTHLMVFETFAASRRIPTQTFNASALSPDHQIRFLEQSIAAGNYVAILIHVRRPYYSGSHFIGVVGYEQKHFRIYDPLLWGDVGSLTKNMDKTKPGNGIIPKADLIDQWNDLRYLRYFMRGYAQLYPQGRIPPTPKIDIINGQLS